MYKQTIKFNLSKMGKRQGWCLQNVRLGFGTAPHYASAKADMLAQRRAGTLHDISSLPLDVSVPIYCDTKSKYEHVVISTTGKIYSDGKYLCPALQVTKYFKVFGWGECCDGSRVVQWEAPKLSEKEVAEQVIAGKWGNGKHRSDLLTKAGYNFYNIQKLVNQMLNVTEYNIYTVQRGDCLSGIGSKLQRDWKKIASDNGIEAPYIIFPGQKLKVYK